MNEKEKLQEVLRYYISTVGVGHTHMMLHGAASTPSGIVIALTSETGRAIKERAPEIDIVPVGNLQGLRSKRKPITFDNAAMIDLLSGAVRRIEVLEKAAADSLMHLETNMDIDGNSMAKSAAADCLRFALGFNDGFDPDEWVDSLRKKHSPELPPGAYRVGCEVRVDHVLDGLDGAADGQTAL